MQIGQRHPRSSIFDLRSSAFTLIEVVLVLVVLAVVVASTAPALRGWSEGSKLNDAARQLLAAAQFARSQAASTATVYRLAVDPSRTSYALTVLDDADGQQQYVPVSGEWGQPTVLPRGFRIELAGGSKETAGVVEFYPDGRTTPATFRVTSPAGEAIEVGCAYPAETFRRLGVTP